MFGSPSRAGSSDAGESSPPGADAGAGAPAPVTIDELVLADEPERWAALSFAVAGDVVQLGSVRVRLAGCGAGRGIVGWSLRGLASSQLDGLATTPSHSAQPDAGPEHRNGIAAIDHVVAMTPDLDRSVRALQGAGLDLRRIREQPTPAGAPRQAFFRLGAEILEVVQEPERVLAERGGADRPVRLWGLALLAPDLDRTVGALAPHAGAVRDAVQQGRRIATLKRSAGLAVPVALMSPRSDRARAQAPVSPLGG
jgi:catechol 2,3-dioxygenase-like lactoylglutathione lyase family enzyme